MSGKKVIINLKFNVIGVDKKIYEGHKLYFWIKICIKIITRITLIKVQGLSILSLFLMIIIILITCKENLEQ